MLISIILINFNTPKLTIDCLNSLIRLKAKLDLDIIVVDNASSDNSVEVLKSNFNNEITLITNEQNLGFAKANNQGAAIAKGEYLVFLNTDTIINDDFISPCIDLLIKNEYLGATSPLLLDANTQPQKAGYGIFPNIIRLITQKTKRDPILDFINGHATVDWISGCAFIIKRSTFYIINGWDPNFFIYYEDIDICKNLKRNSYKVAVCGHSKIIHLGGKSLDSQTEKSDFFYKSQDYYFNKWHGRTSLYIIKGFRFFYKKYLKKS